MPRTSRQQEGMIWCLTRLSPSFRCLKIPTFPLHDGARHLGGIRQEKSSNWKTHINGIIFLGVKVNRRLQVDKERLLVAERNADNTLHNCVVKISIVDRVTTTRHEQNQQCPHKLHFTFFLFHFKQFFRNFSFSSIFFKFKSF